MKMQTPPRRAVLPLAFAALLTSGCASVLESNEAPVQSYVLRAAVAPVDHTGQPSANDLRPVLQVRRVEATAGLDTHRIAVVRADRRFDSYAASRWTDNAPALVESLVVETLRNSGQYRAVFGDAGGFAPDYSLNLVLRRFEAQYSAQDGAPTIVVVLDAALGRREDRALLAAFSVEASAPAAADRMSSVVAAFESATQDALAQLSARLTTALQNVDNPEPSISR
ncbi:MAG TPA: ABC-type transport auxiliary lipoprotein family protein [Steroidobacteraceae bacterium]|nr:ABC-type transport auxiliary lipoprotein family protein [Steroidobacteraceae bacterium]HRX90729.1 ABC-type transport auxiliary lipoprotein family protein [Steroidobacteraceae bacterium]